MTSYLPGNWTYIEVSIGGRCALTYCPECPQGPVHGAAPLDVSPRPSAPAQVCYWGPR